MCASISEKVKKVIVTFFLFFSLSNCRMLLPKYRAYLCPANPDSCKYPRALGSVFGNGIPRSEVQIQLLPSGHKLDYSESWSRRESPVCHRLQRLKPRVLTTFYYPSPQSRLICLRARHTSRATSSWAGEGRKVGG